MTHVAAIPRQAPAQKLNGFFETATALPQLYQAWERVRRNDGGPGGDGVTIAKFSAEAGDRLLQLQRLLRSGRYLPGPLRRVDIPKPDGGNRTLSIPCIADRVAQTSAMIVLTPHLEPEMDDASFAYRTGRSVKQALDRVAGYRRRGFKWVVDGDIMRYFDNIPHQPLLDRLGRSVDDLLMLDLVQSWLNGFAPEGRGIAQGAPISPLLANLYLSDVDSAIAGRNIRLVRFADDFVLMCRTQDGAKAALAHVGALLAERGLCLHPDKTRIVPFDKAFTFLGKMFVRSMVIDDPDRKQKGKAAAKAGASRKLDTGEGEAAEVSFSYEPTPGLRALYLVRPGTRLAMRNRSLTVVDGEKEALALPTARLDRIELWPGTEAGTLALRHALASGIDVAFVDGNGETLGCLAPPQLKQAGLHLEQARHALDQDLRIDLAVRIAVGRLRNQSTLLKRSNRSRADAALAQAANRIDHLARRLKSAQSVDEVMGFEGAAAAIYWPAWGSTLRNGWTFTVRRRRPAPDPVNVLLSMASRLLYRETGILATRHGLHPGFGALHTARDGHPALLSDLVEEFRAPLVEAFVGALLNTGGLAREHFSPGPDGLPRLVPEGYRRVLTGWEGWIRRPVKSPRRGVKVAWRRLVEEQALAYRTHVEGGEPYRPYAMDY